MRRELIAGVSALGITAGYMLTGCSAASPESPALEMLADQDALITADGVESLPDVNRLRQGWLCSVELQAEARALQDVVDAIDELPRDRSRDIAATSPAGGRQVPVPALEARLARLASITDVAEEAGIPCYDPTGEADYQPLRLPIVASVEFWVERGECGDSIRDLLAGGGALPLDPGRVADADIDRIPPEYGKHITEVRGRAVAGMLDAVGVECRA